MNNHQKKISRIVEEKSNAEADMGMARIMYAKAETKSEKRQNELTVRNCMRKLQKIYKELAGSKQDSDVGEWSEDELNELYKAEEMEEFIIRCNSI